MIFENLSAEIGGQQILKNISFSVEKNSSLAIIGPSGSGKTTLAKTLLGIESSMNITGVVKFGALVLQENNHNVTPLPMRRFAYIPQDLALWPHLTVEKTIDLVVRFSASSVDVHALTHACGLYNKTSMLATDLSRGEKQRLALARALAQQPNLIVLDEPFSALDKVAKSSLIKLVQQFQTLYKFSLIFISHDLDEVRALGERVMILYKGEKVWLGDKNNLASAPFPKNWDPRVI